MTSETDELQMEFPYTFPLKVMGLNEDNYPNFVLDVAKKYINGIDESHVKTRQSKNGKYIAVTLTFLAQSREQIDNIYLELNASERTKMAI